MVKTSFWFALGLLALALIPLAYAAEPSEPALLPAAPATPAGQTYDLKYKFKTGEAVKSEVSHRATVDTTIQGTTQTAETRTTSVKLWKITGVDADGNITLEHSVASIDMWQHMKGRQEVSYNSQKDKTPPPGYEDVAKAVGVTLTTATIDSRGKVLKRIENRKASDGSTAQITLPLPSEPVAIGHEWSAPVEAEVKTKSGNLQKVPMRHKYVLEKVVNGIATISIDTQVMAPMHDPSVEAQLIQRMSNGTLRFDVAAGRVVSQKMDLDRRVIGFSGPASSMHWLSEFTEKLLPAATTAAGPAKAVKR